MKHNFILTEDVFRAWGNRFTPIEAPLIEWAQQFQRSDADALDIGAHVGDWAVDMCQHSRTVHAFEPQLSTSRLLFANCKLYKNIRVHPVALSDDDGAKVLHINSTDGGSSSLLETPMHAAAACEPVIVHKLDQYKLTNVALIKLDVEGNERKVIRGGLQVLQDSGWPRIIFESWSYPWHAEERAALMAYLDVLGYKVYAINWPDMFLAEH